MGAEALPAGARDPAVLARDLAETRLGPYRLELATDARRLDDLLRLRYQVFNRELGEGLAASESTGRDRDAFDPHCLHLAVRDRRSGAAVGTYRMQTAAMAAAGIGFYSAGEFELEAMPEKVLARSLELGRACIAAPHRNRAVLFLLWRGLARVALGTGSRYLFGCCSLTSQDPGEGRRAEASLARDGFTHPDVKVPVRPGLDCGPLSAGGEPAGAYALPRLFRTYLKYGARVVSPPAIDREFKTIDFLVLMDLERLDTRTRELFLPIP